MREKSINFFIMSIICLWCRKASKLPYVCMILTMWADVDSLTPFSSETAPIPSVP